MKNTLTMGIIIGLLLLCVGTALAVTYDTNGELEIPVDGVTASSEGFSTSYDGEYTVLTYDIVGNWVWTAPPGIDSIDYLIVAGGGSGGRRNAGNGGAGGGGAGGMLNATNYSVVSGVPYSIIVGAGGDGQTITAADGNNGQNSSFNGIEAIGGGGGAAVGTGGKNGGSGGGGDYLYVVGGVGGNGIPGQGYPGGHGDDIQTAHGGGGGGAGGPGHDARDRGVPDNGGIGRQSNITGTLRYYAGGGAGGYDDQGGLGGGGNATGGIPPFSGMNGTGGGGGNSYGAIGASSGAGGSGVVIIRYLTPVLPVASFTSDITTGIAPLAVQFSDTSKGTGISAWNWSFRNVVGNNTQVWFNIVQNPSHTFGVGNYSIVLNASNNAGYNLSPQTTFINVSPSQINIPTKIGVVRNSNTWLLDASGNGAYGPGDLSYIFGKAGDLYVTGDWNSDGKTEIGVVYNNNTWLLDASGNGAYGAGDLAYAFGKTGDVFVTGDWNGDGRTEIGVVRNGNTWYLDVSGNGAYGAGDAAYVFGKAGDVYVTGDWNSDSKTEIGVVRNGNTWYLDASGNGAYGAGDAAYVFGKAGDVYVTGDWNNDGKTEIGVVRNGNTWLLDASGNGAYGAGDLAYVFGKTDDLYVTGDWKTIKLVAATAEQLNPQHITVTYQGGMDAESFSYGTVTITPGTSCSAGIYYTNSTIGTPSGTAGPGLPNILGGNVGSWVTATCGGTPSDAFTGMDHVTASGTFTDGTSQVILDTFV